MTGREGTAARGYGGKHQRVREKYGRMLKKQGQIPCARCLQPVFSTWPLNPPSAHVAACRSTACEGQCWTLWDAGHTDDREGYNGLEHAACNRRAGGKASTAKPPARTPATSRPSVDYGW